MFNSKMRIFKEYLHNNVYLWHNFFGTLSLHSSFIATLSWQYFFYTHFVQISIFLFSSWNFEFCFCLKAKSFVKIHMSAWITISTLLQLIYFDKEMKWNQRKMILKFGMGSKWIWEVVKYFYLAMKVQPKGSCVTKW